MKTKNIFSTALFIIIVAITSIGIAQEQEGDNYRMTEITYILPEIGMEASFVISIKEHFDLFHKDNPYQGHLDHILTSDEAGWFVWVMGQCLYTNIDSNTGEGTHDNHWVTKVVPNIAKYGRTEYWKFNKKLSYQSEASISKYSNVWFVDVKRGKYVRFESFMIKINEAYKKKGNGNVQVYNNQFNAGDGREVALIWGFAKWTELNDDADIKSSYEEIYGKGSWKKAMAEWRDITETIVSQAWEMGID